MPHPPFPLFRPHWLFSSGHAQTLAGAFLPGGRHPYRASQLRVDLGDGDQIVLHDDCPPAWQSGHRVTLLIHGLAGSHASGYMRRIARKLNNRGTRVFRMDLRGSGAGATLARLPYHSGRSGDAARALEAIADCTLRSPVTLIGFSLGANIVLKLLGELEDRPCGNLDSAMAICPPIDLAACSRQISQPTNRPYDRYFVRLLLQQLDVRRRKLPDAAQVAFQSRPKTLWDFDNEYTAVVCGFGTAENYYRLASSASLIERIRIPTMILASHDDPMIPSAIFEQPRLPPAVQIHLSDSGGHLGFVGRSGTDADRRWMDWRVLDWVACQPGTVIGSPMAGTARDASRQA